MKAKMQIWAVIGQKGGSGKTTTAVGLAVEGVTAGLSVVVVDLDNQTTATKWSDRREDKERPAVVSCQAARLRQVLDAAAGQGAQLVIIDTPGKASEEAIAAAKAAERVLIPMQPHLFDLETLDTVETILGLAGKSKKAASIIISKAPVQGKRHEDARAELERQGFDVAPVMFLRVAHGDSANFGQTAREFEPESKAALEMQGLFDYVSSLS
jgi:chromosome partitioning protein